MSEWQPIETAPKDGTEFLAYDVSARKMDVCTMVQFGAGKWEAWQVQEDCEYGPSGDEFGYRSENIRFWMPLPPSPTEKDEA